LDYSNGQNISLIFRDALKSLAFRLKGEATFWSITLVIMVVDDAAMLAMVFPGEQRLRMPEQRKGCASFLTAQLVMRKFRL